VAAAEGIAPPQLHTLLLLLKALHHRQSLLWPGAAPQ
jgi:hypothetical protein